MESDVWTLGCSVPVELGSLGTSDGSGVSDGCEDPGAEIRRGFEVEGEGGWEGGEEDNSEEEL